METIKFRGKSVHNNEWIFGYYCFDRQSKTHYIFTDDVEVGFEVKSETIGMFTGFKSEKGKKGLVGVEVYEGDVFRQEKENEAGEPIFGYCVVMWIRQRGAFYIIPVEHYYILLDNDCSKEVEFDWLFEDAELYDFSIDVGLPMIGNIYDNPELLKK